VHSLFIDSTSGLVIGLLDSDYSWLEYLSLDEKRPSEIIHYEIFNLLTKYNLNLSDMQCFISSGPGSYTGMRLSEGLAQVFELYKIPVYSFFHFDIPRFSGIPKGFWVTNAFKGQVFIYNWHENFIEKNLINKNSYQIENETLGYTLDNLDPLFTNLSSTKKLIKENAPAIFKELKSLNSRVAPYYFRSLEEEFH
jgi:tRNA threonylcarbamoyladenosine biosynthesis protein TsaB